MGVLIEMCYAARGCWTQRKIDQKTLSELRLTDSWSIRPVMEIDHQYSVTAIDQLAGCVIARVSACEEEEREQ